MSNDFNEHVPEAVHADDLDISEEDMAAVLSHDEPENGIDTTDTPQMTETKAAEDTEVEDAKEEPEAEPEAEAEAEAEPEVEPEAEPEEAQQQDQPRIPKSRFDQVNQQAKEAKAEAEALRREMEALKAGLQQGKQEPQPQPQEPQPQAFDFDAKEQEYMDAVLDGETETALAIRREIRSAEQQQVNEATQQQYQESTAQMALKDRVSKAVDELNVAMPIFNPQSDSFNQEALDKALTHRNGLMHSGMDPVDAIKEAADYINARYGEPKNETVTTEEEAPLPPEKQPISPKKLDTANKQPPSIGSKAGEAADTGTKMNVMSMTEEEFDNLSEAELQKLLAG